MATEIKQPKDMNGAFILHTMHLQNLRKHKPYIAAHCFTQQNIFGLDLSFLCLKKPLLSVWLCSTVVLYNLPCNLADLTVRQICISNGLPHSVGVHMLPAQCQDDSGPRCQTCREGVRFANPVLHFPTFWQVCSFKFPNANWQGPLDLGFGWGQRPAVRHRGQEQELEK